MLLLLIYLENEKMDRTTFLKIEKLKDGITMGITYPHLLPGVSTVEDDQNEIVATLGRLHKLLDSTLDVLCVPRDSNIVGATEDVEGVQAITLSTPAEVTPIEEAPKKRRRASTKKRGVPPKKNKVIKVTEQMIDDFVDKWVATFRGPAWDNITEEDFQAKAVEKMEQVMGHEFADLYGYDYPLLTALQEQVLGGSDANV